LRIATATVMSGIVLLFGALLGVSPAVSFGAGMAALVTGAFALAIAMEDREREGLPVPTLARIQRSIDQ
jgi:hypothetical protein